MKKPEPPIFELKIFRELLAGNSGPAYGSQASGVSGPMGSAHTWITAPGGTTPTFGHIPLLEDWSDPERRGPAGEIRMLVGDVASGFVHLNTPNRKKRFGQLGPVGFVHSVTSAYDEIWVQQGRGGLLLLRREGSKAVILSRNLVEGAYVVVTAFPLDRGHNFRKRKEVRVWPKAGW